MNHGRVGSSWKGPKINEPRKRFVIAWVDGYQIGLGDVAKAAVGLVLVWGWLVLMLSQ